MRIPPRLAGLALLVSLNCVAISGGFAQSLPPAPSPSPGVPPTDYTPQAAITFDDQSSVSGQGAQGHIPRVGARTNQEVTIQFQYSTDLVAQPIVVESLDGALVIGDIGNLAVATDGTATLHVRMGASEGLYRFALFCGDSYALLSFYAVAP